MEVDSPSRNEDLISFLDYLKGWLKLSWRLPSILYNRRQVRNVGAKNRESWGSMLEENAAKFPDNPAVKSAEADFTWHEYNAAVNRCANFFISKGIKKGDVACLLLENRPELLVVYSAMAKIGAINSMINTNLRHDALKHCLELHPARVYIIGEEVIDAFEEIRQNMELRPTQELYFLPDKGQTVTPEGFIDFNQAASGSPSTNPICTSNVRPTDTIAYVFTSGTTGGMPKAAIITHGRLVRGKYFNGKIVLNIQPDDTIYVPLPFFHTNALALSWPTVFANGAAVAIRRKFSVSNFWSDVRKFNATSWCYIGELCRYLMNQPPQSNDRINPLTKIIGNGLRPDIWQAFKNRFDIAKVYEIYGAAESNLYFVNQLNLNCTVGRCSLPYAIVAYDVDDDTAIRDKNGFMHKVEVGQTGLLLGEISEDNPFVGYTSSEATESKILHDVFSKGDKWFNTGDLIRDIGYGHVQFVDRTGDTFRWKGENVSTTEVEAVANALPQISLSTVYGVRMPGGDGRASMIAIIPESNLEDFDLTGLCEHFRRTLPSYAIPKFVRLNKSLEYTPTHKIKKVTLKKDGYNPDRVNDALYVLLPGESEYKFLTTDIYENIRNGEYRF
ncbi:MAG: long-chain-acyl-CoA synthetase [Desulfobacterales bacterium]|jgi:citronellyl-CoA synthetase